MMRPDLSYLHILMSADIPKEPLKPAPGNVTKSIISFPIVLWPDSNIQVLSLCLDRFDRFSFPILKEIFLDQ